MDSSNEFMMTQSWSFFSLVPKKQKSPIHDMLFKSREALSDLMSVSSFTFANSLVEAINSSQPPSMSFFKSLPFHHDRLWGVYLVVFEKPGCRPSIYVGSGTCSRAGLEQRLSAYNNLFLCTNNVSKTVKDKYRAGYRITHRGTLCWCPLPEAGFQFQLRSLVLILESTLSFTLWSMVSKTDDYDVPNICPWSLDSLDYDGLCTHSALKEGVHGEETGLSVEQIIAKQEEIDVRLKTRLIAWKKTVRDKKKFYCYVCSKVFTAPAFLAEHLAGQFHIDRETGNLTAKRREDMINKARKLFHCPICDSAFTRQTSLNAHYKTAMHKANKAV